MVVDEVDRVNVMAGMEKRGVNVMPKVTENKGGGLEAIVMYLVCCMPMRQASHHGHQRASIRSPEPRRYKLALVCSLPRLT